MIFIVKSLYARVLLATILGAICGVLIPAQAIEMKVLGDGFIDLIRLLVGPLVFCTIVQGISGADREVKVARLGISALIYFEVVSTLALGVGLLIGNWIKPGQGFHVAVASLDSSAVQSYAEKAGSQSTLHRFIPTSVVDAFSSSGNLLQVLLLALLFGFAIRQAGEGSRLVREGIDSLAKILFAVMHILLQLAPVGAFGAMAFTVGTYGLKSLGPLLSLVGTFYVTCVAFVVVVLGTIAKLSGFSLWRFLWQIRDEILLVLGTSSSESALAPLMEKLESLGCPKATVRLVVPAGYSFNLDGTNIYLTLAVLFVAQALDIQLSLGQQLSILAVAVVSSKGASAVTGSGFITLAATLSVVPDVPVAGLALILGVDRFMSEARAITNVIGNGVAALALARWQHKSIIYKA